MSRAALARLPSPALSLMKSVPVEARRKVFPRGIESAKEKVTDIMLFEKLRECEERRYQEVAKTLKWKRDHGVCACTWNHLCANRLDELDKAAGRQCCEACSRYIRDFKAGRGEHRKTKIERSAYGQYRVREKNLEAHERQRKEGK